MEVNVIVFSVGDICKRLNVSPVVVRKLLRDRKLKGFKIGSRLADWKILSSDFENFLEKEYEQLNKRFRRKK